MQKQRLESLLVAACCCLEPAQCRLRAIKAKTLQQLRADLTWAVEGGCADVSTPAGCASVSQSPGVVGREGAHLSWRAKVCAADEQPPPRSLRLAPQLEKGAHLAQRDTPQHEY